MNLNLSKVSVFVLMTTLRVVSGIFPFVASRKIGSYRWNKRNHKLVCSIKTDILERPNTLKCLLFRYTLDNIFTLDAVLQSMRLINVMNAQNFTFSAFANKRDVYDRQVFLMFYLSL